MGQLAELLEQALVKDDRPTIYDVPDEKEILKRRVQDETKPVTAYRLGEEERLALIAKYGPPMDPEKAALTRRKYRGMVDGFKSRKEACLCDEDRVNVNEKEEGSTKLYEEGVSVKSMEQIEETYHAQPEQGKGRRKLDITKEQIEDALRKTQGNAKKAIAILQIGTGTFYKYVGEFGIDTAAFRPAPAREEPEAENWKADETPEPPVNEPDPPEKDMEIAPVVRKNLLRQCKECLEKDMEEDVWETLHKRIDELTNRMRDLEQKYHHHRHQTGAGRWSGKAEN